MGTVEKWNHLPREWVDGMHWLCVISVIHGGCLGAGYMEVSGNGLK